MFRALRLHRTIASTPHLHWPAPCAEGGCYEAVDHDARFDSPTPSSIKNIRGGDLADPRSAPVERQRTLGRHEQSPQVSPAGSSLVRCLVAGSPELVDYSRGDTTATIHLDTVRGRPRAYGRRVDSTAIAQAAS